MKNTLTKTFATLMSTLTIRLFSSSFANAEGYGAVFTEVAILDWGGGIMTWSLYDY